MIIFDNFFKLKFNFNNLSCIINCDFLRDLGIFQKVSFSFLRFLVKFFCGHYRICLKLSAQVKSQKPGKNCLIL